MLILVGGRAGEGKTTFSRFCRDILVDEFNKTAEIVAFARGVKDTATFMGWDGVKDDKGRRLLQAVGNAGREYNSNIWVDFTINKIDPIYESVDYIFIDDWRFPNERERILTRFDNVMAIRIKRPVEFHALYGRPSYNDISESSLPDDYPYDFIIDNITNGLDSLNQLAREFATKLRFG